MAGYAQGSPILDIETKCRVVTPRQDVVGLQLPSTLAAQLAGVVISVEDRFSPSTIFHPRHGLMPFGSCTPLPMCGRRTSASGGMAGTRAIAVSVRFLRLVVSKKGCTTPQTDKLLQRPLPQSLDATCHRLFHGLNASRCVIRTMLRPSSICFSPLLVAFRRGGLPTHPQTITTFLGLLADDLTFFRGVVSMWVNTFRHTFIISNMVVEVKTCQ